MKFFVWSVIVVVAAAVVAGFLIVGSPQTERMRKIDDQRVADLQNIQWQIVNFWQSKKRFPKDLNELKDDISGWSAPVDPETGKSYEYAINGELSFALCADFSLEGGAESGGDYYSIALPGGYIGGGGNPKGRHCFERAIDPELYPSFQKPVR